jgi:phosphate transport system protein
LERVGDEATKIAKRVLDLNQEPPLKPLVDIPLMAHLATEMLKAALDAFVRSDAALAKAIIPRDAEVDALNKQLHRELVAYMLEDPQNITRCLHLMVVSKSLERVADHAKNLAEEIIYLLEGRDVRHPSKAGAPSPIPSAETNA